MAKQKIIYSWVTDEDRWDGARKIRFTTDLDAVTEGYYSEPVKGRVIYTEAVESETGKFTGVGCIIVPSCHSRAGKRAYWKERERLSAQRFGKSVDWDVYNSECEDAALLWVAGVL
jgi:hypothetical protein